MHLLATWPTRKAYRLTSTSIPVTEQEAPWSIATASSLSWDEEVHLWQKASQNNKKRIKPIFHSGGSYFQMNFGTEFVLKSGLVPFSVAFPE